MSFDRALRLVLVAGLLGCDSSAGGGGDDDSSLCVLGCNPCRSDDECAVGLLCKFGIFGSSCRPPTEHLCAADSACPTHEQCRRRDSDCIFCDPGPTRRTCEPRICTTDEECGEGYACYHELFGGERCSKRYVPPPEPDARDEETDANSADGDSDALGDDGWAD